VGITGTTFAWRTSRPPAPRALRELVAAVSGARRGVDEATRVEPRVDGARGSRFGNGGAGGGTSLLESTTVILILLRFMR